MENLTSFNKNMQNHLVKTHILIIQKVRFIYIFNKKNYPNNTSTKSFT